MDGGGLEGAAWLLRGASMTLPELTELLKAGGPALAGLVSLIHPVAALARRRRREKQLRESIRAIVQEEVLAVLPNIQRIVSAEVVVALAPLEERLAALENQTRGRRGLAVKS